MMVNRLKKLKLCNLCNVSNFSAPIQIRHEQKNLLEDPMPAVRTDSMDEYMSSTEYVSGEELEEVEEFEESKEFEESEELENEDIGEETLLECLEIAPG